MIDSVVFDLDGTLIDSLPDVLVSLNQLLNEEKRPSLSLEDLRNLIGEGMYLMIEGAYKFTGKPIDSSTELEDAGRRYMKYYRAKPVNRTTIFPNVINVLQKLKAKGFRMGVCTNKPYKLTLLVLEGLGMHIFFDGVTGGDNLPYKKPDPRHILTTLKLMNSEPNRAVMVGDSQIDAEAGKNAGIPVIMVTHGYSSEPLETLNVEYIIDNFRELPQAISQIGLKS